MELYNKVYAYGANKTTPLYYETNDLSLFHNYEFNRDLDFGHVKTLSSKIKDFSICPLLCKVEGGKLFVLDGQHRLEVAKQRHCSVYYRIVDIDSLDIAELQNLKKWNTLNWVEYWAYQGKKDYIRLLEIYNSNKLTVQTIAKLLVSAKNYLNTYGLSTNGAANKNIQAGKYIIKSEDFGLKILGQLKDFPITIKHKTSFVKALTMANKAIDSGYSEYNHDIMVKNISQYPEKFTKQVSTVDYLRMLEDAMNIGLPNSKRVRFF